MRAMGLARTRKQRVFAMQVSAVLVQYGIQPAVLALLGLTKLTEMMLRAFHVI